MEGFPKGLAYRVLAAAVHMIVCMIRYPCACGPIAILLIVEPGRSPKMLQSFGRHDREYCDRQVFIVGEVPTTLDVTDLSDDKVTAILHRYVRAVGYED